MNVPATTFDTDTAVRPLGAGVYEADVHSRWWVGRGPNGGYLGAIVLRALTEALGDPERAPRSLTLHFVARPEAGPVRIVCALEREGRALSTLSARVTQDGRLITLALAAFSKAFPGVEYADATMPDVPWAEDVERLSPEGALPDFVANFDLRWAVGDAPGSGSRRALSGGWLRLAEPRALDPLAATLYTDAWAPAVFSRLEEPVAAPTVDLTVHFRTPLPPRGSSPKDHCLAVFRSSTASEGFWEEDGELWSADGVLLAQSRQLALVLRER